MPCRTTGWSSMIRQRSGVPEPLGMLAEAYLKVSAVTSKGAVAFHPFKAFTACRSAPGKPADDPAGGLESELGELAGQSERIAEGVGAARLRRPRAGGLRPGRLPGIRLTRARRGGAAARRALRTPGARRRLAGRSGAPAGGRAFGRLALGCPARGRPLRAPAARPLAGQIAENAAVVVRLSSHSAENTGRSGVGAVRRGRGAAGCRSLG